jgi:hypothetical protein
MNLSTRRSVMGLPFRYMPTQARHPASGESPVLLQSGELTATRGDAIAYGVAFGLACATGLVLLFINAAAGIMGDGLVNLMYVGVLAVGFVGAVIARFEPRGMALALFATSVAQMLVLVAALVMWKAGWRDPLMDPQSPHPPFHPGIAPVFGLNGLFAMLWTVSGLLFRHAGQRA